MHILKQTNDYEKRVLTSVADINGDVAQQDILLFEQCCLSQAKGHYEILVRFGGLISSKS
jgi:hypothetical protein